MRYQQPPEVPEWIGVAEVAAELGITPRKAWETIKRLRVPCLIPTSDPLRDVRFLRSAWERARDADLAPIETDGHGHAQLAPTPHDDGGAAELAARREARYQADMEALRALGLPKNDAVPGRTAPPTDPAAGAGKAPLGRPRAKQRPVKPAKPPRPPVAETDAQARFRAAREALLARRRARSRKSSQPDFPEGPPDPTGSHP